MAELYAVYLVDLEDDGQKCLGFFEDKDDAKKYLKRVEQDIEKNKKQDKCKAVMRLVWIIAKKINVVNF